MRSARLWTVDPKEAGPEFVARQKGQRKMEEPGWVTLQWPSASKGFAHCLCLQSLQRSTDWFWKHVVSQRAHDGFNNPSPGSQHPPWGGWSSATSMSTVFDSLNPSRAHLSPDTCLGGVVWRRHRLCGPGRKSQQGLHLKDTPSPTRTHPHPNAANIYLHSR